MDRVVFKFSRWSVRGQLMLLVGALTLPALLALVLSLVRERNDALQHAYLDVTTAARNTASELGRMLHEHERLLGRMAQLPRVRALDVRDCDPIIAEYTELQPDYTNLVVRDLSGQNDCSALPEKLTSQQLAGVPGFLEAQGRDGLSVGAAHLGPLSGRWVSVLFYPVKDAQGKVAGLISLPLNLLAVGQRYLGSVAPDHLVMLVDHSGRMLMRSTDAAAWVGKRVLEPLLRDAAAAPSQPFLDLDGVSRFYAAAAVPGTEWRVLAGVPVDHVLAAPNRALGVGLLLLLGCLAAALLAAWRVSLRLVRPIAALSHVATEVAVGNTSVRVPQQTGPKEVEAVARAFNHMLDAREQAQHALSASEERFRMLTALSSDWYWEQDTEFRYTRMDGKDPEPRGELIEAFLGKIPWDMDGVNLTAADWTHHRAQLQSHQPFRDFEMECPAADGQTRLFASSGTPLWDAQGRFCGYCGVARDITERRHHDELRRNQALRIAHLSRRLVGAQEEMRKRFASELHDRTSPNLAALGINLDFITSASPERRISHGFLDRVMDTRALIEDTTASIREICADLHPSALDAAGLLGAVGSYAVQFERRTGLRVTVQCAHTEHRLAPELELALFRIVQEAMTNCAKHAKATRLAISLELQADPVRISITDNGVGMPPERSMPIAAGGGLGLQTMRETAEFLGGRFTVRAAPGCGTQVGVDIDNPGNEDKA